ncbi:MAG: hypothetical protein H0W19_09815 [Nitrosopumilus sp.]|nr:hypothetical protein [Nitrosopumilus sp.]
MFRSNNTKTTTVLILVALATVMIMGPQISSIGDVLVKQKYNDWEDCRDDHSKNWCKKYFKNHDDDDDNDGNRASQGIGQSQSSSQNSQVVSGGDSIGSGNNFSFQNQENSGNNALAQQYILFFFLFRLGHIDSRLDTTIKHNTRTFFTIEHVKM